MSVTEKPVSRGGEECLWFAMSATFGRSIKAKTFLESKSVKCFVPMKYEMVHDRQQGKVRKLIPAIQNLLFAYTTKENIQSLKSGIDYLQYLTMPVEGRNVPIIVPEYQMEQFITVCNTLNENLVYMTPDEIKLDKGTPVKIIGGSFDGIEGTFIKVERKRKKRVVVLVQGIAAVMIAEISDGYIQALNK
ncbi:MAG: UpxY family transcription antiterminator [Bacteroides sp.]|nr:UpxY family transcription antiterminator [Bacteroides sp.]